jgi:hypothetical protein
MSDGSVVARDALFVPPRFRPNNYLLLGVGCDVNNDGWVTADGPPGTWSTPRPGHPQVITAAGAGSAAAIAIKADLVDADVRNAVRDFNDAFASSPADTHLTSSRSSS